MDKRFSRRFFDKANIFFVTIVAVLLLVSFALSSAEKRIGLSADMSGGKLYTLTADTKKALEGLETEIHIYPIHFPGNEFSTTIEIARKFTKESSYIHLREYTDHIGMQITAVDSSIPTNKTGLLIANEDFSILKFITESELYTVEANQTLVKTEGKILSSIEDIARGASAKIRLLAGHGEAKWSDMNGFLQLLQQKNYEIDTYNFSETQTELNPETDLLLIVAPNKDLKEYEYSSLTSFLSKGGHILFFMENAEYRKNDNRYFLYTDSLEYFEMLSGSYGLTLEKNIVLSNDPEYINLRPTSLLVMPSSHELTQSLSKNDERVLISETSSIQISDMPGITSTSLLNTDPSCYAKLIYDTIPDFYPTKEDDYGQFTVAALAEKRNGGTIILFANATCLQDGAFSVTGNRVLLESCITYMTPLQTTTSVANKPLNPTAKTTNSFVAIVLCVLFIGVLPLYFLYLGIAKHMKYRLHS